MAKTLVGLGYSNIHGSARPLSRQAIIFCVIESLLMQVTAEVQSNGTRTKPTSSVPSSTLRTMLIEVASRKSSSTPGYSDRNWESNL
ncbi:hypothetical protein NL528_39335 [Bradyrhizobium sp. Ash2021]|nr:hypothetical protein [Bradyrhizobium sp. Ash2021]WMT73905.1 hypothetical protein NL528_39335 [Bradyrhizobium sp. Ash2021]